MVMTDEEKLIYSYTKGYCEKETFEEKLAELYTKEGITVDFATYLAGIYADIDSKSLIRYNIQL
jgi:hypothetical protein